MADEQQSEPAALSWHERETLGALRRVANARSQLAALEAEKPPAPLDPETARALEQNRAALDKARAKTGSRFGGGSARSRVTDLEANERQLLDHLGMASFDAYVSRRDQPPAAIADHAIIDFARRELQAAEAAWLEVQTLELPDEEEEPAPPERQGPRARDLERERRPGNGNGNENVVSYSRPAAS
jgi:hypothetical protein